MAQRYQRMKMGINRVALIHSLQTLTILFTIGTTMNAHISIKVDGPKEARVGDELIYKVSISISEKYDGLLFYYFVPKGLVYVSSKINQETFKLQYNSEHNRVYADLTNLDKKQNLTLDIKLKAVEPNKGIPMYFTLYSVLNEQDDEISKKKGVTIFEKNNDRSVLAFL